LDAGAAAAHDVGMPKTWLITGCSSGFGREIARAALERGDDVVATARRPEALTDLVAAGAVATALDVTDPKACARAVETTLERFGRIDVLVNNAGNGSVGAVEELTMDELRDLLEVMFFGAVELTKAALPHMREAGSGAIVQISSQGGRVSPPAFGAYCAAKWALEAISEALAAEVAPLGLRVLIVEPGSFRTEFGGARMHRSRAIPAYRASTGANRDYIDGIDGTQPGDPAKAAQAILHALDAPEPPLRLPLGRDAVDTIRAHHEALLRDLAAWEHVSAGTAVEVADGG
jgi:NAD(P)-dependent dehydrogenase (short-subunit alcohol dehydrogenase family)